MGKNMHSGTGKVLLNSFKLMYYHSSNLPQNPPLQWWVKEIQKCWGHWCALMCTPVSSTDWYWLHQLPMLPFLGISVYSALIQTVSSLGQELCSCYMFIPCWAPSCHKTWCKEVQKIRLGLTTVTTAISVEIWSTTRNSRSSKGFSRLAIFKYHLYSQHSRNIHSYRRAVKKVVSFWV